MAELRVVFAGTPEFAVPALQALVGSPHRIVGVLTQPDRPSGRGRKLTASAVKGEALRHGLALLQPQTLKDPHARAALAAWQPDALAVVAYGLILPPEVLALPRLGCLNIHASLLPRWRGAAPIQRAILAGDEHTGVTIMSMDSGLDTGPILLQRRLAMEPGETSGSLHQRLAALGAPALLEALEGVVQGTLQAQPQRSDGAIYAPKVEKSEALIDWGRDALDLERAVRAFNPRPLAETRFAGEPLKVAAAQLPSPATAARVANLEPVLPSAGAIDSSERQSGSIIGLSDGAIWVSCGRGCLGITELQRPGKRRISATDFAHSCNLSGQRFT